MNIFHKSFHLFDRTRSIQSRLYFSNIFAVVFFTVFAFFYWNIILVTERIDNQIDAVSQFSEQMNYSITSLNLNLNRIFHYHNIDSALGEMYKFFSENGNESDAQKKKELQQKLDMLIYADTYISAAAYSNSQKSVYIYSSGFQEKPELLSHYIENVTATTRKYYGSPVEIVMNKTRQTLIPVTKQLIDINTGKNVGYLVIYIDVNLFFQSLDAETGASSGCNTAVFSNGTLIYKTNISPNYFSDSEYFHSVHDLCQFVTEHMDTDGKCKTHYSDIILSSMKSSSSEWQLIKFSKDLSNSSSFSASASNYLYLCMVFYTFLIIFSFFISRTITKDLREFCHLIRKVDFHQLNQIKLNHRTYIELEDLINVYNLMIQKLNEGIQKEYLYDLRQKEMQIKVLNYQINPHFLYNSMNLISSLAILNHIPAISQISIAMSDMFRYSISNRQFVTIEDELDNLKRYILIQTLRFPEKFLIRYDIEDHILSNSCVKLLLQPIVENCFKHAFRFRSVDKKKYLVTITIRRKNNIILISVTDNGCGMEENRLQKLNQYLSDSEQHTPSADLGLGLWNVSKRIAAYYGSQYGICISSRESFYTTVSLTIPYIES